MSPNVGLLNLTCSGDRLTVVLKTILCTLTDSDTVTYLTS